MAKFKNRPEDTPQVIPYLYYEDAEAAIDFMEKGFGFEVESCFRNPDDRKVLHAKVRTGSGVIFVGPGMEFFGTRATSDPEFVSSMIYVFVEDVDAHYARAKLPRARVSGKSPIPMSAATGSTRRAIQADTAGLSRSRSRDPSPRPDGRADPREVR